MSYLVDTNVLSDSISAKPSTRVQAWLDENDGALAISPVSLTEIYRGILDLGHGRKQDYLLQWFTGLLENYKDDILPLDQPVSLIWGKLQHDLKMKHRKMPVEDGIIAATAITHGLKLVTRNVRDFKHSGVHVINPFDLPESESPAE